MAITPLTSLQVKTSHTKAYKAARRDLRDGYGTFEELEKYYHFQCSTRSATPKKARSFSELLNHVMDGQIFWLDEGGALVMDATEPGHNQSLVWSGDDWE